MFRLTLSAFLIVQVAANLCNLNGDLRWMCDSCASTSSCTDVYGLNNAAGGCDNSELGRFRKMYEILVARINDDELETNYLSGNTSCALGSTIATSLTSVHGNICASNERPQLNAAKTNIFCMCTNNQCDIEYTDATLNILLTLLIAILVMHLLSNCVRTYYRTRPTPTFDTPQWKRMVVISNMQ